MARNCPLIAAAALLVTLPVGCGSEPPPPPSSPPPSSPAPARPAAPAATQPTAPAAPTTPPPATPPASTQPVTGSGPVALPGVQITPHPDWERRDPTSRMRVAEFAWPGADGADEASFVVFYFGAGGAGRIDENIDRWCGQFAQPDGTPSRNRAKIGQREINGLPVHTVDLTGTLVAEHTPGDGVPRNEPDHHLLAAIIETEAGQYYIKVVGPTETVGRWRESYEEMIATLEPVSLAPGVPGHP
ncbi:MAG: hypothetical protein ACYTGP_02745 [Planctomycetota bacterium]|jgi:hypothetical protein